MSTFAAVMTGKGAGAISTIQVLGDSAETVIKKILTPKTKPLKLESGSILLGSIANGKRIIDQVTIGCEAINNFTINCHGNPLIVVDIIRLLSQHGVSLANRDEMLIKILEAQKPSSTIKLEAKLAQIKAKTLQGSKIIANQIKYGLTKKLRQWSTDSLEKVKSDVQKILANSEIAKMIIQGCKVVIVGPPNTGKSTLLNCLAGKQKAIVTHIAGTTRDYVSCELKIEPLFMEFIDTAGLDLLFGNDFDSIDKEAQKTSVKILEQADIILIVFDNNKKEQSIDTDLSEKIKNKKVLTILNKSDLPAKLDTQKLPAILSKRTQISAKNGTAISELLESIFQLTGTADFDSKLPICFTMRQRNLLNQLIHTKSKAEAASIISELLNGSLRV